MTANNSTTNVTDCAVQTLELLEERAEVIKEKILVGKVVLSKHTHTRTVNVPITLSEEVLSIQVTHGDAETQQLLSGDYHNKEVIAHFDETTICPINLNGKPLAIGDSTEIVLSREVAKVIKQTYVVEEVALQTYSDTTTHELATQLRHEELDIQENHTTADNASDNTAS